MLENHEYLSTIKSQVLTDKTNKSLQYNKYVFDVDRRLNKLEIKSLIQEVFGVKVISVNSYIRPGKTRRLGKFEGLKNSYKRVFVTLSDNKVIPFFSSL